jgi:hypothetical protein
MLAQAKGPLRPVSIWRMHFAAVNANGRFLDKSVGAMAASSGSVWVWHGHDAGKFSKTPRIACARSSSKVWDGGANATLAPRTMTPERGRRRVFI